MDVPRRPLAKFEGQRQLRSGVVIRWRGTPNLDDCRRVKALLSHLEQLPKREIERLAKS